MSDSPAAVWSGLAQVVDAVWTWVVGNPGAVVVVAAAVVAMLAAMLLPD